MITHPERFDVIVIGGGHAGVEAALASARVGASTLLLTQSIETIGQMSCNPAIGGIGKSHLVREIDALGGAMAIAGDRAGIQFRTLNESKGPAVRATRAQTDRGLYRGEVRRIVEAQENLSLFQQPVVDLWVEGGRVRGVDTAMGLRFATHRVVLATGTFLGGRIHVGLETTSGGRAGDAPSNRLAERLRQLPLRVGRLKTGTPPRIDGRSVDFSVMEVQPSAAPRPTLSFLTSADDHPRQVPCHITHTNPATHDIIRGALDRSPMFSGAIEGVGPRYCPSIEDKVVRFAERQSHQVFVEPEGLDTPELYPNGISTSLPFDVQLEAVRSIRGFEKASITRPGYAIEYDFFDPRDLAPSLETRMIEGLYFAGQINGTTGYEEAAAQGLLAGINAARAAAGEAAWCPARHEAYIGVLVDDLINLGASEPYRMFTSRAEYRLRLRQDNADLRLTPVGRELGVVGDERWRAFTDRRERIGQVRGELEGRHVNPGSGLAVALERRVGEAISKETTLLDLLKRPNVTTAALLDAGVTADEAALAQVEIEAKYEGYIRRQDEEIEQSREDDSAPLPPDFDYASVTGLSNEVRERLRERLPATVAQASRIPGITPAALSLLRVHSRRHAEAQDARHDQAQRA